MVLRGVTEEAEEAGVSPVLLSSTLRPPRSGNSWTVVRIRAASRIVCHPFCKIEQPALHAQLCNAESGKAALQFYRKTEALSRENPQLQGLSKVASDEIFVGSSA